MLLRKFRFKYFIWLLAIICGGSWLGYKTFHVEPLNYMSAMPEVRDLQQQVYATGTLSGKVEVDVGAQVSGQIKKLYVQKGDKVKAGDLLCEIDPEIQENNLKRAQSQEKLILARIASKKAQLEMLKLEHERQQNLLKTNATSKQSAEQAKAQYLMSKADLMALEAEYDQAKISVDDAITNLSYTKIVAPMDGTVFAIPVEEGQTVNANQSTPTILKLANLETMIVETEISEADVVKVKPGMACQFTIMGLPNRYFEAVLQSIDPAPKTADSNNNNNNSAAIYYNAELEVDNSEGILRIDMTAEVAINIAQANKVNTIPISAVQNEKSNGTAKVYQLLDEKKGTIQEVKVKLGLRDDQYVQVLNEDFAMNIPLVIGEDVSTASQNAINKKNKGRQPRPF